MVMIVDPAAPHVTEPDRITSADGVFAATLDDGWAGVVLSVDYGPPPASGGRNLAYNPSLREGLDQTMTYNTGTREWVTSQAKYGRGSAQHTQLSTGTFCGTGWLVVPQSTAGTVIRASAWVKIPAAVTSCFFAFRNASGTVGTVSAGSPPRDQWVRVTAARTLAAGETVDRIAIACNAPTGTVWWADGGMAETGVSAPSDYVDGDQPGCVWEGLPGASPSRRLTSADIRQVRITRTDPAGTGPVAVRSGDAAWAIGGVGTAYDHEAPLGVPVSYTATPVYTNGDTGALSTLSLVVPAPLPGELRDLWIKSLDFPGLSTRVMISQWSGASAAGRQETADVQGSPYRALAYGTHAAESVQVAIDVPPDRVDLVRTLLRSGVLLAQVRPGYLAPDAYFVPGDITGPTPTGKLGSSGGYGFTFTIEPCARPDAAGQPMRMPAWSWDILADRYASWDAVGAAYTSWAALSTNGVT